MHGVPKYDIRAVRKLTHEELLGQRLSETDAVSTQRFPITVVLQDVRSLYNVGSIFRSADSFRIAKLILTGYTPHPPRKEISKTALGAERTVPWSAVVAEATEATGATGATGATVRAVRQLKKLGVKVFAIELTEGGADITTLSIDHFPAAFVLGNELTGVSADVLSECDGAFHIAMHGVKHSLNVAVAAGIVMHQAAHVLTTSKA